MPEPQSIHANEDTRLIPVWSIMAAAVVFLLVEYYFWIVFPQQQHHIPPLGLRIYMNLSWGLLAALYFLMIGFVSKDAPRRSMSSRFWMLICFVMPGGIGAVLYFLLRTPLVSTCAACGTHVQSDFHFVRNATISSRQAVAIAFARCAPQISSARDAAMNWLTTTCRRGCEFWEIRRQGVGTGNSLRP